MPNIKLIILILHISNLGTYIDVTLKLPIVFNTHINLNPIVYRYIETSLFSKS